MRNALPAGLSLLTPEELPHPLGAYSHLAVARDVTLVSVAGQVSVNTDGEFVAVGDVYGQTVQSYRNVSAALACVGLGVEDVFRFNAYVVGAESISEFKRARVDVYSEFYPDGVFPPITLVAVAGLAFPELLVEVECIAARRSV